MFVIKRTDKEHSEPTKLHRGLEEAILEARRLAVKYISEGGQFTVYELVPRSLVGAEAKTWKKKLE